jgi:hypothetical protein
MTVVNVGQIVVTLLGERVHGLDIAANTLQVSRRAPPRRAPPRPGATPTRAFREAPC